MVEGGGREVEGGKGRGILFWKREGEGKGFLSSMGSGGREEDGIGQRKRKGEVYEWRG